MRWTECTFFIFGGLTLLAGILFLFFPRSLLKASEMANRIFEVDAVIFKYRITIGIVLLAWGLFLFLMSYYVFVGVQQHRFIRV